MKLFVLITFFVAIWNVDAFSLKSSKRMSEPWQACFAHIGEGIFKHYAKDEGGEWFAGYIGGILKECLAKEGEEKECLEGKKDEVQEIVKDEDVAKVVEQFVSAIYQIGDAIHGACNEKPDDEIMECAEAIVDPDVICKNENGEEDEECVMFVDILEEKAKECFDDGDEPEKRVLTKPLDRLRSLLARKNKFFKSK